MSKQTRKERKKKEAEMLADFDKEVQKGREAEGKMQTVGGSNSSAETVHCKRCRAVMKNGVCPDCGYKIYVPMSEEKRKKVRLIVTGVCLAVFVILFAFIQK